MTAPVPRRPFPGFVTALGIDEATALRVHSGIAPPQDGSGLGFNLSHSAALAVEGRGWGLSTGEWDGASSPSTRR